MSTEQKLFTVWDKHYKTDVSLEGFITYAKKKFFSYKLISETTLCISSTETEYNYIFAPKEVGHRFIAICITETRSEKFCRKLNFFRLNDYETSLDIIRSNVKKIKTYIISHTTFSEVPEEIVYLISISLSHMSSLSQQRFEMLVNLYLEIFRLQNFSIEQSPLSYLK